MITEVKERGITVNIGIGWFYATIRDGVVTRFDDLKGTYPHYPNKEKIAGYIIFLQEVLEAIEQTKPNRLLVA